MTMKSLFSLSAASAAVISCPMHKVTKNTLSAPASLRTCAIASIVLPVVYTSSITRILSPSIRSVTWNAASQVLLSLDCTQFFLRPGILCLYERCRPAPEAPNCLPAFDSEICRLVKSSLPLFPRIHRNRYDQIRIPCADVPFHVSAYRMPHNIHHIPCSHNICNGAETVSSCYYKEKRPGLCQILCEPSGTPDRILPPPSPVFHI